MISDIHMSSLNTYILILPTVKTIRSTSITPLLRLESVQRWQFPSRFMNLQYRLRNLKWLGQQHTCVIPQRLVQQPLRMPRYRRRRIREIRVIIEVAQYIACLAAQTGFRTIPRTVTVRRRGRGEILRHIHGYANGWRDIVRP